MRIRSRSVFAYCRFERRCRAMGCIGSSSIAQVSPDGGGGEESSAAAMKAARFARVCGCETELESPRIAFTVSSACSMPATVEPFRMFEMLVAGSPP
jgi:hypothetical protein